MNTTVTAYLSEHSSLESELSFQARETDYVRDTSDTDCSSGDKVEYEPVTEPEDNGPLDWDSSGQSDVCRSGLFDLYSQLQRKGYPLLNEIITTKVIEVCVGDDGDLEFADSEQTESEGSDSEMDLYDYWECAQCKAENNNPLYRYCEKCFKVRKNFFPPRPKRKNKRKRVTNVPRTSSVDSGVESAFNSQETQSHSSQSQLSELSLPTDLSQPTELSQPTDLSQVTELSQCTDSSQQAELSQGNDQNQSQPSPDDNASTQHVKNSVILGRPFKRRAESADRNTKRVRIDYSDSDSDTEPRRKKAKSADPEVSPLVKTVSDPALTVEGSVKLTKKAIMNSLKEKLDNENICIICYAEPKSAVFVHGRIAHICCCYECANKVWRQAKRCPQCNCKVSNVLRVL